MVEAVGIIVILIMAVVMVIILIAVVILAGAVVVVLKEGVVILDQLAIIKTLSRSGMFMKPDSIMEKMLKISLMRMTVFVLGVGVIIIGQMNVKHLNTWWICIKHQLVERERKLKLISLKIHILEILHISMLQISFQTRKTCQLLQLVMRMSIPIKYYLQ